jgi:hypothetical protein
VTETTTPQELAEAAAAAIRGLNHSTLPSREELAYPADVSEVVGSLDALAGRLPQLYRQLGAWLEREAESGRVQATDGPFTGDAPAAVATAAEWLAQAAGHAEQMQVALANVHQVTSGLAGVDDD